MCYVGTPRFVQVFVKNKIIDLTPAIVNEFCGTPQFEKVVMLVDPDEITLIILSGLLQMVLLILLHHGLQDLFLAMM